MPDDATCVGGDAKARDGLMTNQEQLAPYIHFKKDEANKV